MFTGHSSFDLLSPSDPASSDEPEDLPEGAASGASGMGGVFSAPPPTGESTLVLTAGFLSESSSVPVLPVAVFPLFVPPVPVLPVLVFPLFVPSVVVPPVLPVEVPVEVLGALGVVITGVPVPPEAPPGVPLVGSS